MRYIFVACAAYCKSGQCTTAYHCNDGDCIDGYGFKDNKCAGELETWAPIH